MKRWLFILMFFPSVVLGQNNLVSNGSFEQIDSCPEGIGVECIGLIEFALGWYEPIVCSSDLFHGCASGTCSIPALQAVLPFDGVGMAQIVLFSGFGNQSREYIAKELSQPLEPDSTYEFSLKLHKVGGETSVAVGSIGAYFSIDSATDFTLHQELLPYSPQLQRNPQSIMNQSDSWYHWQDTLTANGGERFVLIGNFLSDSNTPIIQPSGSVNSGYFVDDVRLTKISKPNSVSAVKEMDIGFDVSPNPATDMVSVDYDGKLSPIVTRIFTVDGREVFTGNWQRNFDVSGLSEGVYLLQVEFENGAVGTQRLVVQR